MVRRTIDGEIERNLHSALSYFTLEPIEILQRTERRFDCFMTTGFASDRPRHARIARLSSDEIVSPLAIGVADRMNRWKINHVEAHGPRVIDSRQTIAKCRSTIAATFGRARKKLVPSGDLCGLALHNHARRRHVLRRPRSVGISRHQNFEFSGMNNVIDLGVVGAENAF